MTEGKLLRKWITNYFKTKGVKRAISILLSPLLQVSHAVEDALLDDCFLRCKHRDVEAYRDVQVNEESRYSFSRLLQGSLASLTIIIAPVCPV